MYVFGIIKSGINTIGYMIYNNEFENKEQKFLKKTVNYIIENADRIKNVQVEKGCIVITGYKTDELPVMQYSEGKYKWIKFGRVNIDENLAIEVSKLSGAVVLGKKESDSNTIKRSITIEQFKEIYTGKGLEYRIVENTEYCFKLALRVKENNLDIIIPSEITHVIIDLSSFKDKKGEDIIINNIVFGRCARSISMYCLENTVNVNNIYFEDSSNRTVEVNIYNINVLGEANLPNCEYILGEIYKRCNINKLIINSKLKHIEGLAIESKINSVNFIHMSLLEKMANSFNASSISNNIDMLECNNLLHLQNSFNRMKNNTEIEINIPNSITNISSVGCLSNIKPINIYKDKLIEFVNKDGKVNIIYSDNVKNVSVSNIGENTKFKSKEINIVIGKISCIPSIHNLKQANIGDNLVKIEKFGLQYSNIEFFDSREHKKISAIEDGTFGYCDKLDTVILGENIKRVGENVFKNCKKLKNVIICNNKINITKALFKDVNSFNLIMVYTDNEKMRNKKIDRCMIIIVDSVEDALNRINSDSNITDENKIKKYELFLHNSDYSILLNDKYKDNIEYLYKIIKDTTDDQIYSQPKIELNKSKFLDKELSEFGEFGLAISAYIDGYNVSGVEKKQGESHSNAFIGMCNLITFINDNNEACFSKKFIDKIRDKKDKDFVRKIIYSDGEGSIVMASTSLDRVRLNLLLIVIRGSVKFITTSDFNCTGKVLGGRVLTSREIVPRNSSFMKHLKSGDIVKCNGGYSESINNISIPGKIGSNSFILHEKIEGTTVVVGIKNYSKINCNHNKSYEVNLLLYDYIIQQFYVCVILYSKWSKLGGCRDCNIYIMEQFGIDENKSIPKEYLYWYDTEIINKADNYLKGLCTSDEDISNIKSDINNYDLCGNKNIIKIARYLYKRGISNIDKIGLLKDTEINFILKMINIENKNFSINKIIHGSLFERNYNVVQLVGEDKVFLEYKLYNGGYVQAVLDKNIEKSKTKRFGISDIKLESIIKVLYSLGESLCTKNGVPTNGISNDPIDINNFIVLKLDCFVPRESFDIALDRYNGDVYILFSNISTKNKYTMFRLKSLSDAIKIMHSIATDYIYTSFRTSFKNIAFMLSGADYYSEESYILIRNEIINGFANGMIYSGSNSEFMDLLCKQPEKSE